MTLRAVHEASRGERTGFFPGLPLAGAPRVCRGGRRGRGGGRGGHDGLRVACNCLSMATDHWGHPSGSQAGIT